METTSSLNLKKKLKRLSRVSFKTKCMTQQKDAKILISSSKSTLTILKWLKSKGNESFNKNVLKSRRSWSWLKRTKDRFMRISFKENSKSNSKEMKWSILWVKSKNKKLLHFKIPCKSNKKCFSWWSQTLYVSMKMNDFISKDTLTTTKIYKRECLITTITCRKMSFQSKKSWVNGRRKMKRSISKRLNNVIFKTLRRRMTWRNKSMKRICEVQRRSFKWRNHKKSLRMRLDERGSG